MFSRPISTEVQERPNGRLHLIQAHDGKVSMIVYFAPTEKWKEAEGKHYFIVTHIQESQDSTQQVFCQISHSEVPFGM
jgi:hypothetical protein